MFALDTKDPFSSYTSAEIFSAAFRYVDQRLPSYLTQSQACLERIPSFRAECEKLESARFKKQVFKLIDDAEKDAKRWIDNDKRWDRASEILKAVK